MANGDLDRSLQQAAARSRELAAMLAAKHDDPSRRYRRIALLASAGAVSIGLLWVALSLASGAKSPAEKRSEPAEEIDSSHYLSPLRTASAGPGEETAPFSGFAISVETEPPGAVVSIAGVPRGEAPVLANVECRPGARLEVAAEKAGFRPARAETACREDALVKLTVRLER